MANKTSQFPKRSASIICQWVMAVSNDVMSTLVLVLVYFDSWLSAAQKIRSKLAKSNDFDSLCKKKRVSVNMSYVACD